MSLNLPAQTGSIKIGKKRPLPKECIVAQAVDIKQPEISMLRKTL